MCVHTLLTSTFTKDLHKHAKLCAILLADNRSLSSSNNYKKDMLSKSYMGIN